MGAAVDDVRLTVLGMARTIRGRPVGFVSGVELTHPDKGTEMMLYELAVEQPMRGRRIGERLVEAMRGLAAARGCYSVWAITDEQNLAARRTYAKAGRRPEPGSPHQRSFLGHPVAAASLVQRQGRRGGHRPEPADEHQHHQHDLAVGVEGRRDARGQTGGAEGRG